MGLDLNDGPIKISLRTFKRDKAAQRLMKKEAITEITAIIFLNIHLVLKIF